tara:strand:- start:176 stop:1003 length:828 start_codon:yes stop_codon:yes gene_type:complete
MTFAEAFADARKRLGPGKTFTYKGKKYTTDRADDVAPSKNNVDKAIDVTPKKKPVEKKTPTKDRKERREIKQEKDFVEGKTDDEKKRDIVSDNIEFQIKDLIQKNILGPLGFETKTLTEKDFGDTTLDALKIAAQNAIDADRQGIIYADYDDTLGSTYSDSIFKTITDPDKIAKTTFGMSGSPMTIGEDGNLYFNDQYNFDNPQGSNFAEKMLMLGKNVIDNPSPYGIMRAISGQFGSGSGEGAPIKINLGPASNFYDEDQLAGIMSTQAAKEIT